MKKNIILTSLLLVFAALSAFAGPAYPGRIIYTQPDGSTIAIRIHGDEYGHWATDEAGNILEQDEEGYWKISTRLTKNSLGTLQQEAAARRAAASEAFRAAAGSSANFGSPKIPVILIGFKDKSFSKTNEEFQAMLSTPGYSQNNAIGSVWDYYNENSFGAFTPQFEVLGPVQLDNNLSYYGGNDSSGNDKLPEMALVHAAQKLDSSVNFARYDNDGDGTVEFVIFYYAGYDEAQSGGSNCIWSHAWYLSSSSNARNSRTFDGVKLDRYFCTAELKGSSGSTMCSIGTTCHEFAHTLGLPDFYDADYSTNGTAASMYSFDLMASGSYNVNSTTPPYFNAEELMEIGWLQSIPEIKSSDSFTLPAVNYPGASSYSAYMTKTSVNNEYFVYETRGGQRWDAGIPAGLMVYHVDKSTNRVSGSVTASSVWSSNSVNNYSAHPCCYVVPAKSPSQTTVFEGAASNFFFGSTFRAFTPIAWNGNATGFTFTNIVYSDSEHTVSFNVVNSNILGISGVVMDSDGNPLSGATVTVTAGSGESKAPSTKAAKAGTSLVNTVRMLFKPAKNKKLPVTRASSYSAVTGSDGSYLIEVPSGTYQVTVSIEGYVSQSATVDVTSMITTQNFYLMREGEELPSVIYAWPADILSDEDEYIVGSSLNSITAQNLYPSSEIGKYAGKQIKEITFFLYGDPASTTYNGVNVIIDYDSERKATVSVADDDVVVGGYTTVDLRDLELVVPNNKDIYAGVGYNSGGYLYNGNYYSFGAFYKTDEDETPYDWAVNWPFDGLVSEYSLTSTSERYSWDVIFDFTLTVGDYEAPDSGYNYIADPGNGSYAAGDVFVLSLIETSGSRKPASAVSWYLDDDPVTAPSITLTPGTHTIEARFTTAEGKNKVVELEISVSQ
ncbi:MAG: M6 family metalloprotease domain-containing protein [Bacteroidales bacterium]|nr:M6 family metalloprotease domain-containing protein [Bacteroidales bacterium]